MVLGRPLFQGSSNGDQLIKIFKIIGTPSENTYEFLKSLPEWKVFLK
jgi:hypothetical protein